MREQPHRAVLQKRSLLLQARRPPKKRLMEVKGCIETHIEIYVS